ncbi:MAG: nuclear transport factor 2 family protein [Halanaeroarchaeum sp.]
MDGETIARRYYRAIDEGDDEGLASLLDADFVHERPDRTLAGRERFVSFMREDRPRTDTAHEVETVYEGPGGVAVAGRLLTADAGVELFRFLDVFAIEGDVATGLRTFTA